MQEMADVKRAAPMGDYLYCDPDQFGTEAYFCFASA
jgi:hypothetical protein